MTSLTSNDAAITVNWRNELVVDNDAWSGSDTLVTFKTSLNSGTSYVDLPLKITRTACPNDYLKLIDLDES